MSSKDGNVVLIRVVFGSRSTRELEDQVLGFYESMTEEDRETMEFIRDPRVNNHITVIVRPTFGARVDVTSTLSEGNVVDGIDSDRASTYYGPEAMKFLQSYASTSSLVSEYEAPKRESLPTMAQYQRLQDDRFVKTIREPFAQCSTVGPTIGPDWQFGVHRYLPEEKRELQKYSTTSVYSGPVHVRTGEMYLDPKVRVQTY